MVSLRLNSNKCLSIPALQVRKIIKLRLAEFQVIAKNMNR